jgi:hypothetical protein
MTRPAAGTIGYGAVDVVIANGGPLKNSSKRKAASYPRGLVLPTLLFE